MADDARLQILIQYVRDEAQAKAALADMDALNQGAKHAGGGVHEAGEGVKFFNVHGREMHRLIHELDHMLPGTGLLLRLAFHPETLGIAALVLGIGLVHKAVEEYKKKLEEAAAVALKADFAAGMEAALEATRSAINEQETYIHNLDEIKRGEHGIAADMANQLQLIAAIKAAKEGQAAAEKTLALAKLKEDQILGRITESDEIIKKGQIEKKFVEDKSKAETENYKAQQKERTKALDEAAAKQSELERARDEAKQKVDSAAKAKAIAKDAPTREDVRKSQEEAEKALKVFQSEFEEGSGIGIDTQLGPEYSGRSRIDQAAAKQKQVQADLLQRRFQQAQQANGVNIEALQEELKLKEKATSENAKALAAARDELNKANRTDTATAIPKEAATRAQEGTIDSQTRAELIQRGRDLQKEFQTRGGGMSQQDAAELLESLRALGPAILSTLGSRVTNAQLKAEVDALKRLIESKGK